MAQEETTQASPVISRPVAGLIGVLATAAAVGVGHLIASLIQPNSSPVLAVGNTFVDLTPGPLKDFAIQTFGRNDKNSLLAGMTVVILVLAVASGLLSRRGRRPGMIIIGVFGLVGLAAVLVRPDFQPTWILPPIVAIAVGLGSFAWLHELASRAGADRAAYVTGPSRRMFLRSSVGVALVAGVAGFGGQILSRRNSAATSRNAVAGILPKPPSTPIPLGADFAAVGTPAYFTPNDQFYRIDTALTVPHIDAGQWQLRIHGMVQREITLRYNDLLRHRVVAQPVTLTCVSNEVGGPLISTSNFVGVPIRDVLMEAGALQGTQQLVSKSSDGFTAATPLDVLMDPNRNALLAIGMNGQPLPFEHGFPVRMVVPGLYGYVSATKWLVDLELTTFDQQGYWEERGWSKFGPIKTESRIDRPQDGSQIPVGTYTAAGIAWAQHTGIDRVEVRLDSGPWLPAQLSTEVTTDTWRMWRIDLQIPPGPHTITCRATDRAGNTQTVEQAPPEPDGATGWPLVTVIGR